MSSNQERIYLNFQEIQSLLIMDGKQSMFGFQAEMGQQVCKEDIWENCCRLMTDGMITQQEGKFRLHRDLYNVLRPVCKAEYAWVLMPGTGDFSQIIYYMGEGLTAMVKNTYGGYSLWNVEDLTDEVWEYATVNEGKAILENKRLRIGLPDVWEDSQSLLDDCVFLLELVETATAMRRRWIRGVKKDNTVILEWTEANRVASGKMTAEQLRMLLSRID